MTTIKLSPLPLKKQYAIDKINKYFLEQHQKDAYRTEVHKRKYDLAKRLLEGQELSEEHPFVREAKLRGLSSKEFAAHIVQKPQTTDENEYLRQAALLEVDQAQDLETIDRIVQRFGG